MGFKIQNLKKKLIHSWVLLLCQVLAFRLLFFFLIFSKIWIYWWKRLQVQFKPKTNRPKNVKEKKPRNPKTWKSRSWKFRSYLKETSSAPLLKWEHWLVEKRTIWSRLTLWKTTKKKKHQAPIQTQPKTINTKL